LQPKFNRAQDIPMSDSLHISLIAHAFAKRLDIVYSVRFQSSIARSDRRKDLAVLKSRPNKRNRSSFHNGILSFSTTAREAELITVSVRI
jgi:hypothetical protein